MDKEKSKLDGNKQSHYQIYGSKLMKTSLFLTKKNSLTNCKQLGYPTQHSTVDDLVKLIQKLRFERSTKVVRTFFHDLSKAYDTIYHNLRICKLRNTR